MNCSLSEKIDRIGRTTLQHPVHSKPQLQNCYVRMRQLSTKCAFSRFSRLRQVRRWVYSPNFPTKRKLVPHTFWNKVTPLKVTTVHNTGTATRSCRTRKCALHFYSPGIVRRSHAAARHVRALLYGPPLLLPLLQQRCCCYCVRQITYQKFILINQDNLKIRHGAIVDNIGSVICISPTFPSPKRVSMTPLIPHVP